MKTFSTQQMQELQKWEAYYHSNFYCLWNKRKNLRNGVALFKPKKNHL